MKRFDFINRRTHLYLGLFVMPWLIMYGVSSFIISHNTWFGAGESPHWQPVFEREYNRPIPDNADLREVSREILKDNQLEGAFWVQRPKPEEIHINRFRFLNDIRLIYTLKDHRLRADQQTFKWHQIARRLHFRGGFQQHTFLDNLWAILVDVACVAILVWIASGLIMWWRLAQLRLWGLLALGGGVLSFLLLVWRL